MVSFNLSFLPRIFHSYLYQVCFWNSSKMEQKQYIYISLLSLLGVAVVLIPIFVLQSSEIEVRVYPRNCEHIQKIDCHNSIRSKSGIYKIYIADEENPAENREKEVFCDMDTDGGGWTVIQRRSEFDRQMDFYRYWNDYASGFGNLNRSHWLGLDTISTLTNNATYKLRIDLMDMKGEERFAEYAVFRVANFTDLYSLHLQGYSGTAGDSLQPRHNGKQFSTKERDHDTNAGNCAVEYHGAWWYEKCHASNLNGLYGSVKHGQGINWQSWKGHTYSMMRVEMKIRTADYKPMYCRTE